MNKEDSGGGSSLCYMDGWEPSRGGKVMAKIKDIKILGTIRKGKVVYDNGLINS